MSAVSLDVAKAHLNITGEEYDDELQAFLDRAEAAIGTRIGPLDPVQVSENIWATPGGALILKRWPVASVASVAPWNGDALDLTDVDYSTGVLTYLSGATFPVTTSAYSVTYLHGWGSLPDDVVLGVLELVRHFWETQRGGAGADKPGSDPDDAVVAGVGYAFPNRVEELIAPYRAPGIA